MKNKIFLLITLPMMFVFFTGAARVASPGCSCDAHGQSHQQPTMKTLSSIK